MGEFKVSLDDVCLKRHSRALLFTSTSSIRRNGLSAKNRPREERPKHSYFAITMRGSSGSSGSAGSTTRGSAHLVPEGAAEAPAPTIASSSSEDGVPPGLVIERSDRSGTGFKGVTQPEKKGPFFVQFRQPDGIVIRWTTPYATAIEAAVAMAQHKLTDEWAAIEATSSDEKLRGVERRQGDGSFGIGTRRSPSKSKSSASDEKTTGSLDVAVTLHAAVKTGEEKMAEVAEEEEEEEAEEEDDDEEMICGLQGCCLPAYHKGICIIPAPEKRTRSCPAVVSSPDTPSPRAPRAPPSSSSGPNRACATRPPVPPRPGTPFRARLPRTVGLATSHC